MKTKTKHTPSAWGLPSQLSVAQAELKRVKTQRDELAAALLDAVKNIETGPRPWHFAARAALAKLEDE